MIITTEIREQVQDLLFEEGACLDQQRWHDWLALFSPDVEYWVPAWKGPFETTNDPDGEVSLIYYSDRLGLEERIWRLESSSSPAHRTIPRTCHAVNNIRISHALPGQLRVEANWRVDFYEQKQVGLCFGYYDYLLEKPDQKWIIAKKKTTLLNDCIPSYVDVYQL